MKQNQYITTVQSGEVRKKHTTGDYGQVGSAHIGDWGHEVKATDVVRYIVKWLGESNEIQHWTKSKELKNRINQQGMSQSDGVWLSKG